MREFFAPWTLAAVALLGLNDAVFKHTFHNAVTGKLSDVAGCFFLPLYVSALLSLVTRWPIRKRLTWGVVVTLGIFVPVSLSRDAADLVCAMLAVPGRLMGLGPYRIAADPTDLMALPCVALAWWYGLKRVHEEGGGDEQSDHAGAQDHGVGGDRAASDGDAAESVP